jgi:hypothetical protein
MTEGVLVTREDGIVIINPPTRHGAIIRAVSAKR